MAKANARQTDNKVSMEEATSLYGRRKALAARRTKAARTALRENLKAQVQEKGKGAKAKVADALKKRGEGQGQDSHDRPAQINPTYRGSDVIPEHLGGDYGPR